MRRRGALLPRRHGDVMASLQEEFADEDAALRGAMRHFVAVGYTQQTLSMRPEFQCPLPAAAKELVAMQTFETPLQARTHPTSNPHPTPSPRPATGTHPTLIQPSSNPHPTPLQKLLCLKRVFAAINAAVEGNLRTHYHDIGTFQLTTDDLLDQARLRAIRSHTTPCALPHLLLLRAHAELGHIKRICDCTNTTLLSLDLNSLSSSSRCSRRTGMGCVTSTRRLPSCVASTCRTSTPPC